MILQIFAISNLLLMVIVPYCEDFHDCSRLLVNSLFTYCFFTVVEYFTDMNNKMCTVQKFSLI